MSETIMIVAAAVFGAVIYKFSRATHEWRIQAENEFLKACSMELSVQVASYQEELFTASRRERMWRDAWKNKTPARALPASLTDCLNAEAMPNDRAH